MPFGIKETAKRPPRPKAEPKLPVFERYIKSAHKNLTSVEAGDDGLPIGSIPAAKGRYAEGAEPLEHPKAAHNWRVVGHTTRKKEEKTIENELVAVSIKVGSKKVPMLEHTEKPGVIVEELEIPALNTVSVLKDLDKWITSLDKGSADGKTFHTAAIEVAIPRYKKNALKIYSYDKRKDDWITHQPEMSGGDNSTMIKSSAEVAKEWRDNNKAGERSDFPYGLGDYTPVEGYPSIKLTDHFK